MSPAAPLGGASESGSGTGLGAVKKNGSLRSLLHNILKRGGGGRRDGITLLGTRWLKEKGDFYINYFTQSVKGRIIVFVHSITHVLRTATCWSSLLFLYNFRVAHVAHAGTPQGLVLAEPQRIVQHLEFFTCTGPCIVADKAESRYCRAHYGRRDGFRHPAILTERESVCGWDEIFT